MTTWWIVRFVNGKEVVTRGRGIARVIASARAHLREFRTPVIEVIRRRGTPFLYRETVWRFR